MNLNLMLANEVFMLKKSKKVVYLYSSGIRLLKIETINLGSRGDKTHVHVCLLLLPQQARLTP